MTTNYTPEQKQRVLAQLAEGKDPADIARDTKVNKHTVIYWKNKASKATKGPKINAKELDAENRRLRAALGQKLVEDYLKQAA